MAKGSSTAPQEQRVTTTTSNLPEYAQPYYTDLMQRAQAGLSQQYTPYGQERIAGFTPEQQQVRSDILGQQTPGQFGAATQLANIAGYGSLAAGQYTPGQFDAGQVGGPNLTQFSMAAPQSVQAQQLGSPQMGAAQTGFAPSLDYFQMGGPEAFGVQQAGQYMSPYMQQVVDTQKREAMRDAQQGQLVQDLGAARQGTYGGSRQLLAGLERERQLGQRLGDIQATGSQAAYQQAQQQFNAEQGLRQQAGAQNLQAALGVQQLGTQTGAQLALANLDAESQSRVQNLAAQLQTQGLNSEQAMRAALANQQAGLTTGQQNLQAALGVQELGTQSGLQALLANQQYGLEAQRLGEQSRQFGSQQGLAGLAQAGQLAQTMGNLGQMQGQLDMSRLGMQQQTAAQSQALQQQGLDTAYADFLRQQGYPAEQLQQYSSLLQGVPVTPTQSQTASAYVKPPSLASQIMGTGLGALGAYQSLTGG